MRRHRMPNSRPVRRRLQLSLTSRLIPRYAAPRSRPPSDVGSSSDVALGLGIVQEDLDVVTFADRPPSKAGAGNELLTRFGNAGSRRRCQAIPRHILATSPLIRTATCVAVWRP